LNWISQEQFTAIDYRVMREVFACHNEMGRLCDEGIYHTDLVSRLEAAKLRTVHAEVPMIVSHLDFSKTYYLDLVLCQSAIYELKSVVQLVPEHEAQVLNYLLLGGVGHGKIINFRPSKVQSRFVNTTLTPQSRRDLVVDINRWKEDGDRCKTLRQTFLDLLEDWGGFLELGLYLEALIHFLGGEQHVSQMIPLSRNGVVLGKQRVHLLTPDIAFRLTALSKVVDAQDHEQNLISLFRHSPLKIIQWINLDHHHINFITLTK